MLIIAMSNTGCSQQTANQSGTGVIGRFLLTVPIVGKLPGLKICNHKTGCVLDRVFVISKLYIWQSHHRETKGILFADSDVRKFSGWKSSHHKRQSSEPISQILLFAVEY